MADTTSETSDHEILGKLLETCLAIVVPTFLGYISHRYASHRYPSLKYCNDKIVDFTMSSKYPFLLLFSALPLIYNSGKLILIADSANAFEKGLKEEVYPKFYGVLALNTVTSYSLGLALAGSVPIPYRFRLA